MVKVVLICAKGLYHSSRSKLSQLHTTPGDIYFVFHKHTCVFATFKLHKKLFRDELKDECYVQSLLYDKKLV